ncbi:WD40 repeat-like protein [Aureobasidium melanogenum CBS 110374]|uniref:WD40 repeat-like protein n=1 Tax=Aureobasidium melanogenum (strain CBS 110374) TaxID=1043003 RepID=A0A074VX12_AURM1|nr:WD40 repeat-like protein [Aureobasidium melanogenum CBS 110374]KEQ62252.1 WD40 repeat-like protein [Aureobasidium melanogenum CBS 110374]
MSRRGRVTVDLSNDDSPPPLESQRIRHVQHVPDSRFITPDSDDEIEVLWEMRKQRPDEDASNILRSNAGHHLSTIRPTAQKPHPMLPSNDHKQAAQPLPTQPKVTRASKQPAPTRPEIIRPHATVFSAHRPPLPSIPTQARYNSPVSIANPATNAFLAAISKSGGSTPSTAPTRPTLPPGAKQLPLPTPTPPTQVIRHPMGPAASHPTQFKEPVKQSQPLSTSAPRFIARLDAPPLNMPSRALFQNTSNEISSQSRDVPSRIVPSSEIPAMQSSSSVNTSLKTAVPQPRKEPMAARSSPQMPPSSTDRVLSPAKQPLPVDELVTAADCSKSLESAPPSHNSPRLEKRKVAEDSDDEEPVKRLRRTRSSSSVEINTRPAAYTFPADISKIPPFSNNYGQPFTPEEDALIVHLKEVARISWKEFEPFFPGRKWHSMQTRYSRVLKDANTPVTTAHPPTRTNRTEMLHPTRKLRRNHAQTESVDSVADQENSAEPTEPADHSACRRRSVRPLSSLVRHRELGSAGGREWPRKFQAGVRDFVYGSMGAQAYMDNASGDVSTIAWSPDGKSFAAGAVAVTDAQSIDYNKPRNLVVGSLASQNVKELPDHTIQHTLPDGRRKELFSTVQMVAFSPDSRYMYSAGIDRHLHKYRVDGSKTTLVHRIEHPASVDFLSVSNSGLIATGCASAGPRSIQVFSHNNDALSEPICFSGTMQAKKTPSALKWGSAHVHQNYLLAGFSREAEIFYIEDDHRDKEGEVALWDINTKQRIETDAPNRNVFDLAWNPNPGGNSSIFAVASRPVSHVGHGIHSIVRLYSPQQTRAHHTMELDCPAWDINDVVYSPHDNNLIAVGSTEGRVYIWDVRFAKHGQSPLNTLKHGESLAVMPHEKKRWEVDTGIRFLSWGSERDRLYTGSSDGVVACWDPYRTASDKRVRDVVQLNSAVMSGAFSPDFAHLLVGEDAARLNLLSVGNDGAKFDRRTTAKFSVEKAPMEEEPAPILWDCQKMLDTQALEIKPAGTMPFQQVVQGPNYKGPHCADDKAVECREKAQKFQDKVLRSYRRRNKQTRKLGIQADPCSLDCGFIPPSDEYYPPEKWLSRRIPGRNERADIECFRCGRLATVSPRADTIECGHCGTAWKTGALGYEVVKRFKAEKARSKVEEGPESSPIDLCDSEDEWERFIRETSTESSDLDGGY